MKLSQEEIKTLALEYVKSRHNLAEKTPIEIAELYADAKSEFEKLIDPAKMKMLKGGI